jgi:hypothetical protein
VVTDSLAVFAAAGPTDPSLRARVLGWRRWTEIDIDLRVGLRPALPRTNAHASTLILRNAHRLSTGRIEQHLLRSASFGIYELDDGLPWDDGCLPGLGHWWKRPFRRDRLADRAGRAAHRIIVGNSVLAEWARTVCDDVVVIPTCVEPGDYVQKQSYRIESPPRLVWLGSAATQFEIEAISSSLAEVHRRCGARLTLLGAARAAPRMLQGFTDVVPWTEHRQHEMLATMDIGLMPLSDGVYQRAKCGYKLLQYGAAALPSVASPVGVNADMIAQGLAAPADDWVGPIMELIEASEHHRSKAAQQAMGIVQNRYSYKCWAAARSAAIRP